MVGFCCLEFFLRSNGLTIWQTSSRIIPNQWLSTCDDGFREEVVEGTTSKRLATLVKSVDDVGSSCPKSHLDSDFDEKDPSGQCL